MDNSSEIVEAEFEEVIEKIIYPRYLKENKGMNRKERWSQYARETRRSKPYKGKSMKNALAVLSGREVFMQFIQRGIDHNSK